MLCYVMLCYVMLCVVLSDSLLGYVVILYPLCEMECEGVMCSLCCEMKRHFLTIITGESFLYKALNVNRPKHAEYYERCLSAELPEVFPPFLNVFLFPFPSFHSLCRLFSSPLLLQTKRILRKSNLYFNTKEKAKEIKQ